MASNLSIAELLAELERQVAHHRDQERRHAEELKTALERVEAFRAASTAAEELVERHRAPAALEAPTPLPSLPDHKRRPVSWLVAHVVAQQEPEAAFTPSKIAREVNQHFGSQLRRPLDGRAASVTLRRLAASGRLHLLREGTPHHEALYSCRQAAGSSRG